MQNIHSPVQFIRAAHDLTIELGPASWRLFNGSTAPDSSALPVALCTADRSGIVCAPAFARARQLPADGRLAPADIARVVVGWAPESHNWHLGLLLTARPENGSRMRWCGLASWPSGPATQYRDQARQAGAALSALIARPLHLIPPPTETVDPVFDTQPPQATARIDAQLDSSGAAPAVTPPLAYAAAPAASAAAADIARPVSAPAQPAQAPVPAIALAEPPFAFEDWRLAATRSGLAWTHRRAWTASTLLRAVGSLVMGALFILMGIGTQTSGLAAVNPSWLPWLGLVVGALLVGLAVRYLRVLLTAYSVRIDFGRREITRRSRFGGRIGWRIPFEAVQYVLVSQTPAHPQGRKHASAPMSTTQDVWLHLYDGRQFWPVVALESVEGVSHHWDVVRSRQKQTGRRALHLADYDTPAHHAAIRMAEVIGTDLWLDIR